MLTCRKINHLLKIGMQKKGNFCIFSWSVDWHWLLSVAALEILENNSISFRQLFEKNVHNISIDSADRNFFRHRPPTSKTMSKLLLGRCIYSSTIDQTFELLSIPSIHHSIDWLSNVLRTVTPFLRAALTQPKLWYKHNLRWCEWILTADFRLSI